LESTASMFAYLYTVGQQALACKHDFNKKTKGGETQQRQLMTKFKQQLAARKMLPKP